MICYFREDLKLFIKVEMEQQNRESMDFKEMVQRAVNTEAKAGLRSRTIIQESDICCLWGYRLSHNTSSKVQTQRTIAKKPCIKESRPKEAKSTNGKTPALPCSNELSKSNRKKKKWEWLKKKKDSTPATRDNAIEAKKKRTLDNTSQVTSYNCQKNSHFANKCPESPKN